MRSIALAIATLCLVATETATASSGTAATLASGAGEIGVFRPLSMGIGENTEAQVQPLVFFLSPHISLKQSWWQQGPWQLSTEHRLSYPTQLLKQLRRKGIGGLIEAEAEIPTILAAENSLLVTQKVSSALSHTLKYGFGVAARFEAGKHWQGIETPLIFSRTAAYHKGVTTRLGWDVDYRISSDWRCYVETDVFRTAYAKARWHYEGAFAFVWHMAAASRLEFGAKMVFGEYFYGNQSHVLPLVDWVWDFDHGLVL